jgi:multidrug resistance protein, MATE family
MPSPLRRLATEMGATARLAAPLVLGQAASVGMNVVDSLLAGRHEALTLAAVGVGSAVWSLVILILIGVLMAVPPSVSQLHGAGRPQAIGPLFRQALWLALAMGLGLFVLVRQSGWLLAALGVAAEVRPPAEAFLAGVSWGAPGLALYLCLRYVSEGVALTRPTMVFGLLGLLLLVPLGWLLLWGGLGLPPLGAYGLGLATAIVLWLQALGLGIYMARSPQYAELDLFTGFDRPNRRLLGELLWIGVPMGVSIFMEGSLFVATALLIATLGAVEVGAHQIAINIAALCFMVPLGIAMATTVRVGQAVGRRDPGGVRWAAGGGYAITALTQVCSALLLLLAAEPIARAYTADPDVVRLAAQLMLFAAIFQLSDGLQAASGGALRGLKDTRVPMLITVVAYWGIGMPVGWWLGLRQGGGAPGMWVGLIIGLSVAALLLTWRFLRMARGERALRWHPEETPVLPLAVLEERLNQLPPR